MKTRNILLAIGAILTILLAGACASQAGKEEPDNLVKGKDDSDCDDGECDSIVLQSALDAAEPGSVITLDGVFDFGKDQFVSLKKDVTIVGTLSKDGAQQTIIRGGTNTFALGWDPGLGIAQYHENCRLASNPNTERWPARFEIADLRFEDATWSTIMAATTTGATIRNNQFIGGSQIELACNTSRGKVPEGAMSAIMFSTAQEVGVPVFGEASDISGHIEIEGNYFDGQVREDSQGFDPSFGFSSLLFDEEIRLNGMRFPVNIVLTTAQVIVSDNDFENIQWGLDFVDNSGEIRVERNRINMNPEDATGDPIGFVHGGIWVESNINAMRAPVVITDNEIIVRVREFVHGIYCASKAATIKDNTLTLMQTQDSLRNPHGVSAGIYLGPGSEDNVVEGNVVEGSGQSAIVVSGFPAENNVIRNNAVDGFTPMAVTDSWCRLEGRENCRLVPGAHYHLIDRLKNNTITEDSWEQGIVLLDETSDYNPYDPSTYNGKNIIISSESPE